MRSHLGTGVLLAALATPSLAQTPRPFPGATAPPAPVATAAPAQPQAPAPAQPSPQGQPDANGPTSATVGFSIFPGSTYLASYDAGKGQRYYLFGTTSSYTEVVTFYRAVLKDRGAEVFEDPLTHMFAQRYNEQTMVFPPGVTVKDWSGPSKGYPNPRPGTGPERFPTIVMIVPPPAAVPAAR